MASQSTREKQVGRGPEFTFEHTEVGRLVDDPEGSAQGATGSTVWSFGRETWAGGKAGLGHHRNGYWTPQGVAEFTQIK